MYINNKFNKDGKLDKEAVKKDIRIITDKIIKRQYPDYNTGNNRSSSN